MPARAIIGPAEIDPPPDDVLIPAIYLLIGVCTPFIAVAFFPPAILPATPRTTANKAIDNNIPAKIPSLTP